MHRQPVLSTERAVACLPTLNLGGYLQHPISVAIYGTLLFIVMPPCVALTFT